MMSYIYPHNELGEKGYFLVIFRLILHDQSETTALIEFANFQ